MADENTNPKLGSIAEQSVKDAVVRGRKRRPNRQYTTTPEDDIQITRKVPSAIIDPEKQIPYHKRRKTNLITIGNDEDEDDSNDEWEEHIEVTQHRIQSKAKAKLKSKPNINSDEKNKNEDNDNIRKKHEEEQKEKAKEREIKRIRRLTIANRKRYLQLHSIHICLLVNQLLQHDALANDELFQSIVYSIVPEEMLNHKKDFISITEKISILVLWIRITFISTIHPVKFLPNDEPPTFPSHRLCNLRERIFNLIQHSQQKTANLFDVLTIIVSVLRCFDFHCRIVSPLQLIPCQLSKLLDNGNGVKNKKKQHVTQSDFDFHTQSIMFAWIEIWNEDEKKWKAFDILQGVMCHEGEPSDILKQSAQCVPLYTDDINRKISKSNNNNESSSSRTRTRSSRRNRDSENNSIREKESSSSLSSFDTSKSRRKLPDNFFAHVVAVENGIVTDVTSRYHLKHSEVDKMRASGKVYIKTIEQMDRSNNNGKALNKEEKKRIEHEKKEFEARLKLESIPNTISGLQKHPLYVLERHVKKYEAIHPKEPICGYLNDTEPIYPRSNLHLLHTKDRWIRQMKQVLDDSKAIKTVKSKNGTDAIVELFGFWQTQPLVIDPVAQDGTVPTGPHGNVDLWTDDHLPKGGVHVNITYAKMAAKKLSIPFAPAMTGFELRRGRSVPKIEGVVVATQYEQSIRDAAMEIEFNARKRLQEKAKNEALQRWSRLLRSIKARETIRKKYGGLRDGVSYETLQKRQASVKQCVDKHGDASANKGKTENTKPDIPEYKTNVHIHEYAEERHIEGDTWEKTCKGCGIVLTFEKL